LEISLLLFTRHAVHCSTFQSSVSSQTLIYWQHIAEKWQAGLSIDGGAAFSLFRPAVSVCNSFAEYLRNSSVTFFGCVVLRHFCSAVVNTNPSLVTLQYNMELCACVCACVRLSPGGRLEEGGANAVGCQSSSDAQSTSCGSDWSKQLVLQVSRSGTSAPSSRRDH